MSGPKTRVLLLRGHHPTPWGVRPWERLPERFDVRYALTRSPRYSTEEISLPPLHVRTLRDRLPRGAIGDYAALVLGDRILGAGDEVGSFDVVHAEELSLWFSAQAAALKRRHGFKLAITAWETIPLLDSFRSPHARRYRRATLEAADVFLAASERARDALLLEGAPPERVELLYPGVEVERFAAVREPRTPPSEHLLISPGRLEWEKGHQDVIRAVAASGAADRLRLLVVGSGPEEKRLRAHAAELGVADRVEFRSVPHSEMPELYARASTMVLASLPRSGCALHPGDVPRCFWEEQFGMVLVEAMAAGLPLLTSTSGAIPEVAGGAAIPFAPGDWPGLARLIQTEVLAHPPGRRVEHDAERIDLFSVRAAAERLEALYDRLVT